MFVHTHSFFRKSICTYICRRGITLFFYIVHMDFLISISKWNYMTSKIYIILLNKYIRYMYHQPTLKPFKMSLMIEYMNFSETMALNSGISISREYGIIKVWLSKVFMLYGWIYYMHKWWGRRSLIIFFYIFPSF